jgi:hypothetical protein
MALRGEGRFFGKVKPLLGAGMIVWPVSLRLPNAIQEALEVGRNSYPELFERT